MVRVERCEPGLNYLSKPLARRLLKRLAARGVADRVARHAQLNGLGALVRALWVGTQALRKRLHELTGNPAVQEALLREVRDG
jgi:hypothetical protein